MEGEKWGLVFIILCADHALVDNSNHVLVIDNSLLRVTYNMTVSLPFTSDVLGRYFIGFFIEPYSRRSASHHIIRHHHPTTACNAWEREEIILYLVLHLHNRVSTDIYCSVDSDSKQTCHCTDQSNDYSTAKEREGIFTF